MRLSELLGRQVRDEQGGYLGTVADVVLTQDGPMRGPYAAGLRLSGVILVERRHVRLLGYDRDSTPWLQRAVVRRLAGRVREVPWRDLSLHEDGSLRMRPGSGPAPDHVAHDRSTAGR
jgi:hypothetical protein